MSVGQLVTTQERHAYMLRLPISTRSRVLRLARRNGVSYNAMLNILISEALDTRDARE